MADIWETANGLDPTVNDDNGDLDQDFYTNLEEYQYGLDPNVVENSDTDAMPDGWEYHNGLDILVDDAAGDFDGDGLSKWGQAKK